MEVVVQAASEVPHGCFVSVRIGEHLKQRRFNKSSATYNFPVPEEKAKARLDVYQLVGTCSVPVDPATPETTEVSVIGSDPNSEVVKLRVSTASKEVKPEEAQKQRQEIEAETKDAAVGYLSKHGIEQKLTECLRTVLRMKPEDPIEFMCKFLSGGTFVPEAPSAETKQGPPKETKPAPEGRQNDPPKKDDFNEVQPVAQDAPVPFALRPSVGTWLMPRKDQESNEAGSWVSAPNSSFNLKGLGHTSIECCEVERLLTKALLEMDGELQGDYYALGSHPLKPGGLSASEKDSLGSKKLLFEAKDIAGRGIYVTEKEDLALWINAEKHLQILVHQSAKSLLPQKIDMVVSALSGPLIQDGYTLSP